MLQIHVFYLSIICLFTPIPIMCFCAIIIMESLQLIHKLYKTI